MGKKEEKLSTWVTLVQGDLPVDKMHNIQISFEGNQFVFEELTGVFKQKVVNTFKLDVERIISLDIVSEENYEEKQKSVIGRGIAGSVLFGEVGLLLGGLSGTGNKQKKVINHFFVVSYFDKENDVKTLIFKNVFNISDCESIIEYYKENYLKKDLETNDQGEYLL